MKILTILASTAIALVLAAPAVAEEKAAPTAQQMKMKACNQEASAKELKSEDRKKFMSSCLSGKATGTADKAQTGSAAASMDHPQCAEKAVGKNGKPLAGAARSSFMKKCANEM